ncbi:hypothetical protein BT69DRAFT_1318812 [Atractiella rhizophila]|nr:hypothetical protein BT69DRAFT_1318812 [Atractiella rhizophila]
MSARQLLAKLGNIASPLRQLPSSARINHIRNGPSRFAVQVPQSKKQHHPTKSVRIQAQNPLMYKSLQKDLNKARVTVEAEWQRLHQGGLVLLFPDGTDTLAWIKTGIEVYDGRQNVSTVATPAGGEVTSDWSLVPISSSRATIEIERKGVALWVYIVGEDGKRSGVREVTWTFGKQDAVVEVGVYCCRPSQGEGTDELTVSFSALQIE